MHRKFNSKNDCTCPVLTAAILTFWYTKKCYVIKVHAAFDRRNSAFSFTTFLMIGNTSVHFLKRDMHYNTIFLFLHRKKFKSVEKIKIKASFRSFIFFPIFKTTQSTGLLIEISKNAGLIININTINRIIVEFRHHKKCQAVEHTYQK